MENSVINISGIHVRIADLRRAFVYRVYVLKQHRARQKWDTIGIGSVSQTFHGSQVVVLRVIVLGNRFSFSKLFEMEFAEMVAGREQRLHQDCLTRVALVIGL